MRNAIFFFFFYVVLYFATRGIFSFSLFGKEKGEETPFFSISECEEIMIHKNRILEQVKEAVKNRPKDSDMHIELTTFMVPLQCILYEALAIQLEEEGQTNEVAVEMELGNLGPKFQPSSPL
jgi:hypothetical protein